MAATILNWVLGLLTLLLGGTNIVTLVQLRSLRAKGTYEAESVQIENLRRIIETNGEEIARLSVRLKAQEDKTDECGKKCEERLDRLEKHYKELLEKHNK